MIQPNFIIVGAEKAGTTSVAAMLAEHPEIFISKTKELRFFSGTNSDKSLEWYQQNFSDAVGCKAIGEASPSYTWATSKGNPAPKRIHEALGDIKYIYLVRHPVKRLISHYRHGMFCRWFPEGTTFEEALKLEPRLFDCSRYYFQLKHYFPYTEREQWWVTSLEEFAEKGSETIALLLNFLNVSPDLKLTLDKRNDSSNRKRNPGWYVFLRGLAKKNPLWQAFRTHVFSRPIGPKIGKPIDIPDIDEEVYIDLERRYLDDVEKLSEWTGKDYLTIWGMH